LAAANDTEFAWELARLISALPDPHVSFVPAITTIKDQWSAPDSNVQIVDRRLFVTHWGTTNAPEIPTAFKDDPFAYPEIISVRGCWSQATFPWSGWILC
jgi:hypothetical protein